MRILQLRVIAGTYNYGEPVFGDNMTKEEAERTVIALKDLQYVPSSWLGLSEQEQAIQMRYKVTNAYLQEAGTESNSGLIIIECEGDTFRGKGG